MPKTNGDPGPVPNDLTPKIHLRLALLIERTDRFRTALAIQRQIPQNDANLRMRLIELEHMGVWFPELVPERGRRATETALLASTMVLRMAKATPNEIYNALPGIVVGARAVSEAYEAASMPGVLNALNAVERCFEESQGQLFQSSSDAELREACLQLVTALRIQDAKADPPAGRDHGPE